MSYHNVKLIHDILVNIAQTICSCSLIFFTQIEFIKPNKIHALFFYQSVIKYEILIMKIIFDKNMNSNSHIFLMKTIAKSLLCIKPKFQLILSNSFSAISKIIFHCALRGHH